MTDRYGRTITDHGDNLFSVEGIELIADDLTAALATFNAMAPADWTEPSDEP
jgi:hypothetical protein